MKRRIIRLVREVIGVDPHVYEDSCCTLRSGKRQVREFFQRFGFPVGRKAATVEVPSCVMKSKSKAIWIGFLRGPFSSDGSFWFGGKWGQCRFEVSSIKFRNGFIALAERLGFQFRRYSYLHRGGHNKLRLHTAYLETQREVLRWMETVGSISDTHIARYRKWRQALVS